MLFMAISFRFRGPRHTHSSELLGVRRIDFIFLPAQWRDGVAGSWVDYDMDMLSPNDDHFMPVCDFKGRVYQPGEARGPRSKKLTRKFLRKATPQSVDAFFSRVFAIPVPQWDVPPHLHKQLVDSQIWDAAEELDIPKHVPKKIFANEKIVELSVTRMWHLRRKTTLKRLLRRFALRRFFDAWRGKVAPVLHLEHLMPPGELALWYEMVWHANQLIATQPVQKRQVQQATAEYLVRESARVNTNGGDLWEVAEPLRRSQGGKKVRAIGRIIPCVESAQGEL